MQKKQPRKLTLVTFSQSIFLNVKFFLQNRLLSYAGACSFSLLFSFIPVFMLVVVVLIRILHASPDVVSSIFGAFPELEEYFPSETVIRSVQSAQKVGAFEFLIGIFVFWMARRFFASIFDSMQNIFRAKAKRKAMRSQFLMLFVEAVSVCVSAAVIFAYISLETLAQLPALSHVFVRIPVLSIFFNGFFSIFVRHLPNILIFAVVLTMYKTVPGTKPRFRLCLLAAFLCTLSFGVFRFFLHLFLNTANYNLIYGMLGQVIITLMDIFFFFTFFLFFAQYIFVCQFFDELLVGELYLLPKREEVGFLGAAKLILFIRADFLLAENKDVISLSDGDFLFSFGDESDFAFYVADGTIIEERRGSKEAFSRGDFLGEVGCVLQKKRDSAAFSKGSSRVIKINSKTFRLLARKNSEIAHKVLSHISSYFDQFALEDD
mgnify:CR=1 FL=1